MSTKDLITWGFTALALILSSLSLYFSKASLKQAARLNLYPRRMNIYNICIRVIGATNSSVFNNKVLIDDKEQGVPWNDVFSAGHESKIILPTVSDDINKLFDFAYAICLVIKEYSDLKKPNISVPDPLLSSARFNQIADEAKAYKEKMEEGKNKINEMHNRFFETYNLVDGPFIKKLRAAMEMAG